MKFDISALQLGLDFKVRQPATLSFLSIAAILIYYGLVFQNEFQNDGFDSAVSISSHTFQKYVMACLGGSIAMLFSTLTDLCGKYVLQDKLDPKYATQLLLILTILLPSLSLVVNADTDSVVSVCWPMFHIQIVIILNLAIAFWARKMELSLTSPTVLGTSLLQTAAFTLHVFVPGSCWTQSNTEASAVAYMALYCVAMAAVFRCLRLTYNKNMTRGKDAVVLIDTAAAEQQWALAVICTVFAFYAAFLVLEAGVYGGVARFHLSSGYLSANYVLLSSIALVLLTLHKRKELYHGVMSQVCFPSLCNFPYPVYRIRFGSTVMNMSCLSCCFSLSTPITISQTSLEIKRLFVRYVSHEIRTPPNTTLLGLNLLQEELQAGILDATALGEVVQDSTGSCTIAIGILNDLLLYEKIDGGLLTLEREEMSLWAFVEDTLRVFLIQVGDCLSFYYVLM